MGRSLRSSGQDRLRLGWSQPQKELEGELSRERKQLWQHEPDLFENQKAKVAVEFGEQEVPRVRNSGRQHKERFFPS